MDGFRDRVIKSAAKRLKGVQRRMYLAEVCRDLCDGSPRCTEKRFGWGRETIRKGIEEIAKRPYMIARRSEVGNPQLAIDIQLIVG